jgi:putative methionine-R-sulfoxide reductase with GAF domain
MVSSPDRFEKARELARIIRDQGQYRWVGVYDVGLEEVAIISWSGPSAPAYPTFSISRGLTASAISEKRPVIVGDVRNDPRYLTAFGSTLSEIIIPVLDSSTAVIGTIDVESERANAFSVEDCEFLEQCAQAALPLWSGQAVSPARPDNREANAVASDSSERELPTTADGRVGGSFDRKACSTWPSGPLSMAASPTPRRSESPAARSGLRGLRRSLPDDRESIEGRS